MVYELNTIHVSEVFTVASPLWRFHDDFKIASEAPPFLQNITRPFQKTEHWDSSFL